MRLLNGRVLNLRKLHKNTINYFSNKNGKEKCNLCFFINANKFFVDAFVCEKCAHNANDIV